MYIDKMEVLKMVLVNSIANEIEEMMQSNQISKQKYREFFQQQEDIMDTVPDAIGDDYFNKKLLELSDYLYLSKEILEDTDDEFDERDIGKYINDTDNDLPEKYKTGTHIVISNEHLLFNITSDCINHFQNKDEEKYMNHIQGIHEG